MLMKKCMIWIIPTRSLRHFKRRGNIFSSVLDMDILEWKMLWKTQTRIILKRKKVEQEEKEEEEKEEEIEEEEEEEEKRMQLRELICQWLVMRVRNGRHQMTAILPLLPACVACS